MRKLAPGIVDEDVYFLRAACRHIRERAITPTDPNDRTEPAIIVTVARLERVLSKYLLLEEDRDWWKRQAYTRADLVDKLK